MPIKRRKKRKPYTLHQLQTIMATAVRELESIYLHPDVSDEARIRAINGLAALCNSYSKLYEVTQLETRVTELEHYVKSSETH